MVAGFSVYVFKHVRVCVHAHKQIKFVVTVLHGTLKQTAFPLISWQAGTD